MGTRSFNIIANPKGDFTGAYCHWDGYPSHNGRLLLEHYSTKGKARELIRLGTLSSLGKRAKPINPDLHSFDCKESDTTVAYGRDRGEAWENVKPEKSDMLSDLVDTAAECWCEYVYLFWNGHWSYNTIANAKRNKAWEPLTWENTAVPDKHPPAIYPFT
jgi:hypothetical protein